MCIRHASCSGRNGMTLVEILVVVAIIVTLAGMAFVLFGPSVEGRYRNNTTASILVIRKALDAHWSHVVNEAQKEEPIPGPVLTLAGNDRKRARVVLTKLRLMEAFPVSYGEINNRPYGSYLPIARYQPTYKAALQGKSSANNPYTESAACLLLALSINRGGHSITPDDLKEQAADTDNDGLREIVDGWGNAILFFRFPTDFPALQAQYQGKSNLKDPLDPFGTLLPSWAGRTTFTNLVHKIGPSTTQSFFTSPVLVSSAGKRLGDSGPQGEPSPGFQLKDAMIVQDAASAGEYIYSFNLRQ